MHPRVVPETACVSTNESRLIARNTGVRAQGVHTPPPPQRNQIQENTISVQFVPGMHFLAFDFGV
eukprot:627115-Rhodomonas_salina.3